MYPRLFLGDDGAVGAGIAAAAAVQASTSVDDVRVVTLADSTGGADISAGTAADASRSDLVGHGKHLHKNLYDSFYHTPRKKQGILLNFRREI